jgi:type VI secretion system protein ImpA
MADSLSLDLTLLLKPISDDRPTGESLRRSDVYDRIREARREEDGRLSQGVWKTDVKRADWDQVAALCTDALKNRSKDLRIAAWLAEAWLYQFGAGGIEQAFRLIEKLVNQYWETLYPPIDDGDLEGRLSPIQWINDKLSVALKNLPLTRPETKEPQIYTWLDWEQASVLERSGKKAGENEVTTSRFMTCVLLTPAKVYAETDKALSHLWDATIDLEKAIDRRAGTPVAALWQFKEVLQAIRGFVQRALDQKAEEEPESVATETAADGGTPQVEERVGGPGVRWGPIRNRAEAYQRLSEAAEYLVRTEPHSPTALLVQRAVSWGNMTFTELIQELVLDQRDLGAIYSLLGVKK